MRRINHVHTVLRTKVHSNEYLLFNHSFTDGHDGVSDEPTATLCYELLERSLTLDTGVKALGMRSSR